jgi:hypothetical protein
LIQAEEHKIKKKLEMSRFLASFLPATFSSKAQRPNQGQCVNATEQWLIPLRRVLGAYLQDVDQKTQTVPLAQLTKTLQELHQGIAEFLQTTDASCALESALLQEALLVIDRVRNHLQAYDPRDVNRVYDITEHFLQETQQWEMQLLESQRQQVLQQHPCLQSLQQLLQNPLHIVQDVTVLLQQGTPLVTGGSLNWRYYYRVLLPELTLLNQHLEQQKQQQQPRHTGWSMSNQQTTDDCSAEEQLLQQAFQLLQRIGNLIQQVEASPQEGIYSDPALLGDLQRFQNQYTQYTSPYIQYFQPNYYAQGINDLRKRAATAQVPSSFLSFPRQNNNNNNYNNTLNNFNNNTTLQQPAQRQQGSSSYLGQIVNWL